MAHRSGSDRWATPSATPEAAATPNPRPPATAFGDGFFSSSPFLVVVRIRPGHSGEESLHVVKPNVIRMEDDPATVQDDTREMPFEVVVPATASQEDVYSCSGRPLLERVLAGYNGSILAYGSTGSGKSHTLFGPARGTEDELGIVPRLAGELFARLADYKSSHSWEGIVEATYVQSSPRCAVTLQVYSEHVYDLLDDDAPARRGEGDASVAPPTHEPKIHILPNGSVDLHGATRKIVKTYDALRKLVAVGDRHSITSGAGQQASPKSHTVLTLHISITDKDLSDGNDSRSAKLHFVVLAGSERSGSKSAAKLPQSSRTPMEAGSINRSLSALGNTIDALTHSAGGSHIPYRDSKLTSLLADSLGRHSFSVLIACVSTEMEAYGDTLSTLRWASRAKLVKGVVTIRGGKPGASAADGADSKELDALREQLRIVTQERDGLRAELAQAAATNARLLSEPGTKEDGSTSIAAALEAALAELASLKAAHARVAEERDDHAASARAALAEAVAAEERCAREAAAALASQAEAEKLRAALAAHAGPAAAADMAALKSSLSQAERERDHHAEAARREAASAAVSKAEAAQLRAALSRKDADTGMSAELLALQAAHAQAVRERDHHAEAAKREAASASASKAEAAGLRDALAQKNSAQGAAAGDLHELESTKAALAQVVRERDAAEAKARHETLDAAAAREAAAKAAREIAELRAHASQAKQEHHSDSGGNDTAASSQAHGRGMHSATVVPMDSSGAVASGGGSKSAHSAGKGRDGGCCGTKSPVSATCWVLLFVLTFLVGAALGLLIGVPAAYYH